MPTNDDKINQLYKNYAGMAHTNKNGPFSDETIPAVNLILSENIRIDPIPKSDISTITQLVYDSSWVDSSGTTPSYYESNTYSNLHPNENIEFYKNLKLTAVSNSNNFAWYKLDGSGENILKNSIHFKYDNVNSAYAPNVTINNSEEFMLSNPYEWAFDNETGILQFYGTTPNPTDSVKISFYKYVGRMGLGNLEFSISGESEVSIDSSAVIDLSTNFYILQSQFITLSGLVQSIDGVTEILGFDDLSENFYSLQTQFIGLSGIVYNLDNSVNYLYNFINDISNISDLSNLIGRHDISISALFSSDSVQDISISTLFSSDSVQDISISTLFSSDSVQDISISTLFSSDSVQDISISTLFSKNNVQDTSINLLAPFTYVDALAQGLKIHDSVKCATIENIDISGYPNIDTYITISGDRILVKDQIDKSENGIYKIHNNGIWLRDPSMDQPNELAGSYVFVVDGSINKYTGWVCTNDPSSGNQTDNIGPVHFSQFSQAGLINPGTGLTQTGNTFNVREDLTINNGKIYNTTISGSSIDNTVIGQNIPVSGHFTSGYFTQLLLNGYDISSLILTVSDLSGRDSVQDISISALFSSDSVQDISISALFSSDSVQDISITALFSSDSVQDISISALFSSDSVQDISISRLFSSSNIEDISISALFSSDSVQDISISALFSSDSVQDISISALFSSDSVQDISISRLFSSDSMQDISISALFSSDSVQDISISALFSSDSVQDISISALFSSDSVQDISISALFSSDSVQDISISALFSSDSVQDISISALFSSDSVQDISISALFSSDSVQDISISRLFSKNNVQDTSINLLAPFTYVDALAQGLKIHDSVKCATIENIDISGYPNIDTYITISGDRILVKDQIDKSENGIYKIHNNGIWLRDPSMDQPNELAGSYVFVVDGSINKYTGWVCTNDPSSGNQTDNIGPVHFSQFSQAGLINPGTGLTQTGNTFNVREDLTINNGKIYNTTISGSSIDNTVIGQNIPVSGHFTSGYFTQLLLNGYDISSLILTVSDLSGRDSVQDISISALFSSDSVQDISISLLFSSDSVQDISISSLFSSDSVQDISISALFSSDSVQDISISALFSSDSVQDISISALFSSDSVQDISISALFSSDSVQDISISALQSYIYDICDIDYVFDLINISNSVDLLTDKNIILDSSITVLFLKDSIQDISISALFSNFNDLSTVIDSIEFVDLSQNFYLLQSQVFELSGITELHDISISVLFNTLDSNFIQTQTIIALQDFNINILDLSVNILDTCINQLELKISIQDSCINQLELKNYIQDSCINQLELKNYIQDSCINQLGFKNSTQDICINSVKDLVITVANNTLNELTYLNGVFSSQANKLEVLTSNAGFELNQLNAIYMINTQQIMDLSNIVNGLRQQIIDLSSIVSGLL